MGKVKLDELIEIRNRVFDDVFLKLESAIAEIEHRGEGSAKAFCSAKSIRKHLDCLAQFSNDIRKSTK